MILFASPDFGAGACICGLLGIVWAVVLLLVFVGFGYGAKLLGSESRRAKRLGILLMVACLATPLLCCFGPRELIRLRHGNYPLGAYPNGKIANGMSQEEVIEILGTPHERLNHPASPPRHSFEALPSVLRRSPPRGRGRDIGNGSTVSVAGTFFGSISMQRSCASPPMRLRISNPVT